MRILGHVQHTQPVIIITTTPPTRLFRALPLPPLVTSACPSGYLLLSPPPLVWTSGPRVQLDYNYEALRQKYPFVMKVPQEVSVVGYNTI
jgi:hypothetical protein